MPRATEPAGGEPGRRPSPPATPAEVNLRRLVVASARNYLGGSRIALEGRDFGADCSALVRAVYVPLGVDPVEPTARGSRTAMIYRWLDDRGLILRKELPAAGDVAFFHNTYDRNGDGVANDLFTHVALLEEVEPDGTFRLLHRDSRRVSEIRMNLRRPDVFRDGADGPLLNSILRRPGRGARKAPRLAGELFVAFGSPVRALLGPNRRAASSG